MGSQGGSNGGDGAGGGNGDSGGLGGGRCYGGEVCSGLFDHRWSVGLVGRGGGERKGSIGHCWGLSWGGGAL